MFGESTLRVLFIGAVGGAALLLLMPGTRQSLRPVVKSAIKSGVRVAGEVDRLFVELREGAEDLAAEIQSELAMEEAHPTPRAAAEKVARPTRRGKTSRGRKVRQRARKEQPTAA
jgi:hypothetical protein